MNRRIFIKGTLAALGASIVPSAVVAQSNDRSRAVNTSATSPAFGFSHPNGLIIFFKYDGYSSEFGDRSPYYFPSQTNVETATHGIRMVSTGSSSSKSISHTGDSSITLYSNKIYRGLGQPPARLTGAPLLRDKSYELSLTCGNKTDKNTPEGKLPVTKEKLTPLSREELDIIATRTRNEEISLYEPPPAYQHFRVYLLPDGNILLLSNDVSGSNKPVSKAFTLNKSTGLWTENKAQYYAPDAPPHPMLKYGWDTDIGFLQHQGLFKPRLWFARNKNAYESPKEAIEISVDEREEIVASLLRSPASKILKAPLPNPCNELSPFIG